MIVTPTTMLEAARMSREPYDISERLPFGSSMRLLASTYAKWRQHHEHCPRCLVHDWFSPGLPRLLPGLEGADIVTEATLQGKKVKVYAVAASDPKVLCPEGQSLFRGWVALAAAQPTSLTRAREPTPEDLDDDTRDL